MKRISLFLLSFSLSLEVFAQMDLNLSSHFIKDSSENSVISFTSNFFTVSNAITNELLDDYYFHRFIDDDVKDVVSRNLSAMNHLGGEIGGNLSFTFRPDSVKRNIQGFISLRHRLQVNAELSKDFFELLFRGNKGYADKKANLSDFHLQSLNYSQFAFGIGNEFKIKDKGKLYAAVDLGINFGNRFLKIDGGTSSLYTSPTGEYLDADINATIQIDDSSTSGTFVVDGYGFSTDLYLEYVNENNSMSFSVENLGAIRWNRWSTEVKIDSSFRFEGIDVSYLFDLKDSIRKSTSLDSAIYYNFVSHREEKRITTVLPLKISGSYSRYFLNNRLQGTAGIDVLKSTAVVGRYFLAANYKVHLLNQIGIVFAYGGNTGFHGGLNYVHLFPSKLRLEIGSNYLFSMINYNAATNQGAYFTVSKSF